MSRITQVLFRIILALLLFSIVGCESDNVRVGPNDDTGTDGDADGDTDTDTDSDTDSDSDSDSDGGVPMSPILHATVRDFSKDHPDFEAFLGIGDPHQPILGIVETNLGLDNKPVYSGEQATHNTGEANFLHWYNTISEINYEFDVELELEDEDEDGLWVFNDDEFFPIGPEEGWGAEITNHPDKNFSFTTEIHTEFTYQGGETFRFVGDDDLWAFINKILVIDLGGVHGALESEISLDTLAFDLGLEVGETYPMEIFHAERREDGSHFRIETTIYFEPIIE